MPNLDLPYRIPFDYQRVAYVQHYLDSLESPPSSAELATLATFIIKGVNEDFISTDDLHLTFTPSRDHPDPRSFSLDSLVNKESGDQFEPYLPKPTARLKKTDPTKPIRPIYSENGTLIDPGDSDIPGMQQVWQEIDQTKEKLQNPDLPPDHKLNASRHLRNLYTLARQLKAVTLRRRSNYHLKTHYAEPNFSLTENTGLWLSPDEWCARYRHPKPTDLRQPTYENAPRDKDGNLFWLVSDNALSLENPIHVRTLLQHYTDLLLECYDKINSDLRALLWDLEDAISQANLTDLEQFLLESYVAHRPIYQIQTILQQENIELSDVKLGRTMRIYIPKKIALAAAKHRLFCDPTIPRKTCSRCGQALPLHPVFFAQSREKRCGYCSQCKECQKAKYKEKNLNANMPQMQEGQNN